MDVYSLIRNKELADYWRKNGNLESFENHISIIGSSYQPIFKKIECFEAYKRENISVTDPECAKKKQLISDIINMYKKYTKIFYDQNTIYSVYYQYMVNDCGVLDYKEDNVGHYCNIQDIPIYNSDYTKDSDIIIEPIDLKRKGNNLDLPVRYLVGIYNSKYEIFDIDVTGFDYNQELSDTLDILDITHRYIFAVKDTPECPLLPFKFEDTKCNISIKLPIMEEPFVTDITAKYITYESTAYARHEYCLHNFICEEDYISINSMVLGLGSRIETYRVYDWIKEEK